MKASVLVPYRPGEEYRDRAWQWVRQRWERCLPEYELIVGTDNGGEDPGVFNHPLAINRAAAESSGDVLIVADCDTAFDPRWVRQTVELIGSGLAPWAVPYWYDRTTELGANDLLAVDPTATIPNVELVHTNVAVSWSGVVIVPRRAFEAIGGYDERFQKWGADDVSFAAAMNTLWGQAVRPGGTVTHIWHPQPLDHSYGHDRHREQHELMNQYVGAIGQRNRMMQLRGLVVRPQAFTK